MVPHLMLAIDESSQVGEARRMAVRLAEEAGLDAVETGRVALVVTELGTNLTRHAQRGRLLLAGRGEPRPSIEVVSLDHGPGMADIENCLRDGYSTGGTAGTGFGSVRRLADSFSAFSQVGKGTVIAARIAGRGAEGMPAARFEIGAIAVAAPGETACGDGWGVRAEGQSLHVVVADGLGHGPAAADAARAALAAFEAAPGRPAQVLERAHAALRNTRGAALAVAELDAAAGKIVYCGAGNIAGRVISGVQDRSLPSAPGTVGLQIRQPQETTHDWPEHALVVLHSDGLASRWNLADAGGLFQCDPLVVAGWLLREHSRGRDDATVLVIRRA